ncbi:odorant receptor 196 [Nasonia vitripennis]|uniref:Odorant receptor n=1 Tax=Nasonia vitripennis TaxID=7425 RepID=A0A7M6UE16_NASVI|nr:odorant receptor 196 [Nasonia vitripennis]
MAYAEEPRENILESSTFLYSKSSLRVFGLWPYQEPKQRLICRTSTAVLIGSLLIPTICIVLEQWRNFDYVVLGLPSFLYYVEFVTKYMYLAANQKKLEQIFGHIKNDFDTRKDRKLEILKDYATETRLFNHIYAAYLIIVVVMFNLSFYQPHFLDLIMPLNESRPRPIPRLARYYVTSLDESFNFVVLHGLVIDWYSMIFFLGHDTLLVNCAQHACALFKIVINDIQDCLVVQKNDKADDEDQFYRRISNTIDLHKWALEYTAMVDKMYMYVNLCIIGVSLLAITLSQYQTAIHLDNTDLVIRYSFFSIGELVHILYFNWPGQRIRDHSLSIYQACYNCEWYRDDISYRCKKLLKLMMARSQLPSNLSAGKLYVLGYENFAQVLKASLSFFTVLLSVN